MRLILIVGIVTVLAVLGQGQFAIDAAQLAAASKSPQIPRPQMGPGKQFGHDDTRKGSAQYCGGEIRERIKNDGRRILRCEECKQEWDGGHAQPLP